jgi:hypothetical protein
VDSVATIRVPVHPHGIHCLHRHGWLTKKWCPSCRIHWQNTSGKIYDPVFAANCDRGLAYQVLREIETGEMPLPPTFALCGDDCVPLTPAQWAQRNAERTDAPVTTPSFGESFPW